MATPLTRQDEGAVRSGEAVDCKGCRQPSWRPSDNCPWKCFTYKSYGKMEELT
jgi:hypothetical protein